MFRIKKFTAERCSRRRKHVTSITDRGIDCILRCRRHEIYFVVLCYSFLNWRILLLVVLIACERAWACTDGTRYVDCVAFYRKVGKILSNVRFCLLTAVYARTHVCVFCLPTVVFNCIWLRSSILENCLFLFSDFLFHTSKHRNIVVSSTEISCFD